MIFDGIHPNDSMTAHKLRGILDAAFLQGALYYMDLAPGTFTRIEDYDKVNPFQSKENATEEERIYMRIVASRWRAGLEYGRSTDKRIQELSPIMKKLYGWE